MSASPTTPETTPDDTTAEAVTQPETAAEAMETTADPTPEAAEAQAPSGREQAPKKAPSPTTRPSGGGAWPLWLLLLLIAGAIGVVTVPNPWQGKARQALMTMKAWWQPQMAEEPVATREAPSAEPQPAADERAPVTEKPTPSQPEPTPVAEPSPRQEAAPRQEQEAPPPAVHAATEQPASPETAVEPATAPLDHQLDQLHRQLQQVTSSQQQLVRQQQAIAANALRQQIALLTSVSDNLEQSVAAWRGVAQLPALTPQARQKAEAIAAQATRLLATRRKWQRQLQQDARLLHRNDEAHRLMLKDIAAIADSPLTDWLDRQFSLYRLPSAEQRQKNRFAARLQQMARAMEQGAWPAAEAWRHARQQIGYWLDPEHAEALPKGFDGFRQQLQRLHQQQAAWIEEVQ